MEFSPMTDRPKPTSPAKRDLRREGKTMKERNFIRKVNELDIWKMYVQGLSCTEIARQKGFKQDTIRKWIFKELKHRAAERDDLSDYYLEAESVRLDEAQKHIMPNLAEWKVVREPIMDASGELMTDDDGNAMTRDMVKEMPVKESIELLLKVMERRAKMYGTDKPQKVEIEGNITLEQIVMQSMEIKDKDELKLLEEGSPSDNIIEGEIIEKGE